MNTATGEALEPIQLIAPVHPPEYGPWRATVVEGHGLGAKKLNKTQQRLLETLPETLPGALRAETTDLQAVGWSSPPGARFVIYQRPMEAFRPRPTRRRGGWRDRGVTAVRLALAGKPLPRLENAVRIGEIARMAAMRKAENINGGEIPAVLSGHELSADNRHGHAFYLPEDADGDGYIDHILVHAPDGLPPKAVRALDRITRLWERDGGEWQVLFEGHGALEELPDTVYTGPGRVWLSVTPYLHPWHRKKNKFGPEEQIRRECRERDLPEPERIEPVERVAVGDRERRPVHFHRFRSKPGLAQPDTQGAFWRLTFPEPVEGPLALGFGCHFGLGAFRSEGVGR